MIIPVLLAGGVGTRLWPLSRQSYPKQFLPLLGDASLFQETLLRLEGLPELGQTIVLAQADHRFLVSEQLRQQGKLSQVQLILEPAPKNTAPAIALAAFQACAQGDSEALLLVLPADHRLGAVEAFQSTVLTAAQCAKESMLVTFGVPPTRAETGYGYIECGAPITKEAYRVKAFVEKPNQKTAEAYLSSGNFWWNSGMFVFKAKDYLNALSKHAPDIYESVEHAMNAAVSTPDYIAPDAKKFSEVREDSIDYAILEKEEAVAVVPLTSQWCDVGSWASLAEQFPEDAHGNVAQGNVELQSCQHTFVRSEHRLVAAVGVEDLVIVETADALLVLNRKKDQAIKQLVKTLQKRKLPEMSMHRRVHRPWGTYECLDNGARYQVKRISVNPGAKLSLQLHHHRSEHWVIVKGSARVTRGDEEFLLTENQSTYIPIGITHRLENVGKIPLEIIEVQSGSYLGEDDIVRLEDTYGRLADKKVLEEV